MPRILEQRSWRLSKVSFLSNRKEVVSSNSSIPTAFYEQSPDQRYKEGDMVTSFKVGICRVLVPEDLKLQQRPDRVSVPTFSKIGWMEGSPMQIVSPPRWPLTLFSETSFWGAGQNLLSSQISSVR